MEFYHQNDSIARGERKASTYSFSTYPRLSFSEGDSDSDYKETSFFFSYEEASPIKTFTPQIIISSYEADQMKKIVTKGTVNRADCIRKRIKTHFNQYMLKVVNKKISSFFPSLALGKLSQRFIADVKIESNKEFIELPIRQVFTTDFKGSKNHLANKMVLEKIFKSDYNELKCMLERSYSDFFSEYMESEFYMNDLKKFQKKEGESYTSLYKKFSKELIEYYRKGTPYKRRRSSVVDGC
jgi:hypothetical protein